MTYDGVRVSQVAEDLAGDRAGMAPLLPVPLLRLAVVVLALIAQEKHYHLKSVSYLNPTTCPSFFIKGGLGDVLECASGCIE